MVKWCYLTKVTIKNSGIAGKLTLNLTVTNNFGCSSTDVIEITNRPVVNVTLNASAPEFVVAIASPLPQQADSIMRGKVHWAPLI